MDQCIISKSQNSFELRVVLLEPNLASTDLGEVNTDGLSINFEYPDANLHLLELLSIFGDERELYFVLVLAHIRLDILGIF